MSPTKFYKPKKAKKAKKAKNWVQEWAIAALYTDSDDDSVSTVDDFDDIISEMGEEVTLETDQEQDKMVSQVLRVLFESYEHYDIEKDYKGRNLQGLPDAPSDGDTELMVLMVIDHTTEYFQGKEATVSSVLEYTFELYEHKEMVEVCIDLGVSTDGDKARLVRNVIEHVELELITLDLSTVNVAGTGKQIQKHGFTFENEVRWREFGLPESSNSTSVHDIPKEDNTMNPSENVSVKTTGSMTICCGSVLNFMSNYDFDDTNTIIVKRYVQDGDIKKTVRLYEINYNRECHALLFGNLPPDIVKEYVEGVSRIPTKVSGEDARKIYNWTEEKTRLLTGYTNKITINPKVSSNNSRVQCSISNFEEVLANFITYKSPLDSPSLLRNKVYDLVIHSLPRNKSN